MTAYFMLSARSLTTLELSRAKAKIHLSRRLAIAIYLVLMTVTLISVLCRVH